MPRNKLQFLVIRPLAVVRDNLAFRLAYFIGQGFLLCSYSGGFALDNLAGEVRERWINSAGRSALF